MLFRSVYALWMKFFQISWILARTLSALLTAFLGGLIYEHVCRQTRTWLAGLAAVILFASSTLVFTWFTVVKTYSLAGLFLFCAYVVVSRLSAESSPWLIAAGGLLFGLSVDTRSYLVLITPLFLWWIFHNSETRTRLCSLFLFLGGFVVGIFPCFYLFVSSPEAFLFDNLGYHMIRANAGLIGMCQQKLSAVHMLFGGSQEGNGVQATILFALTFGFIFSIDRSIRRRRYPPRLAFQIGAVLSIISFLPTPAYTQYFCLCVPFLLVGAVCVVNDLYVTLESSRERLAAVVLYVVLLGIYLGAGANDFRKVLTNDEVPGLH